MEESLHELKHIRADFCFIIIGSLSINSPAKTGARGLIDVQKVRIRIPTVWI